MPFDPMSMQPPMDPMMAEEPMDVPMAQPMQPLPPGNYQRLAQSMGQPQMSYAFNPVTDSPEFDVSVLGEDVMGVPMDRSMGGTQMGMPMGGMGMGMESPEMEGMEMEDEAEDAMATNPEAKSMAMAALQGKTVQRQAATDGFQANATKLARTMRGPQSL